MGKPTLLWKLVITVLFSLSLIYFSGHERSRGVVAAEDDYYEEYEEETKQQVSSKGNTNINVGNQKSSQKTAASVGVSLTGEGEEYEYEYEYEYEEEEAIPPTTKEAKPKQEEPPPQPFVRGPEYNGYLLHGGGGLMRVTKPMVDGLYLNESSKVYDCPKKEEAFILMLEADPDMDETSAEMLMRQVQGLRKRMEHVHQLFNNVLNETASTPGEQTQQETPKQPEPVTTSTPTNAATKNDPSTNAPKKRLSFREKQAMRMQEKQEQKEKREKVKPKFRLGADCETLLCGSCKAVVEEFAELVYENIKNPKMKYLDQVSEGLCRSKGISLRYNDIVNDTCQFFLQDMLGYKETLISSFEVDTDWKNVRSHKSVNPKKKKVCLDIGACSPAQFEFQSTPAIKQQEHWDDKCFVCQAYARDLEEKVQLHRTITESSVVGIVANTCNRLNLEPKYHEICKPLVEGKLLDDISWLAKVHGESIARRAKGEQKFEDKLCEEIDWCKPWIDPQEAKEKEAEKTLEQVFF